MSPDEYCQDKAARSGSSFYYSFLFLPPPQRRAITALYAFCREVDDTVDEATDAGLARTKLDWWRTEVQRLYRGEPQHPVTRALEPAVAAFGIDERRLLEIIAGMQMDLDQSRYLDFAQLRLYCHRVAGVVGELSAAIFSPGRPGLEAYAGTLGIALQLTNIIRDVGEDARRGRIYLPAQAISEHGVDPASILRCEHSKPFEALLADMSRRAHQLYDQAIATLPSGERSQQRPGLIMAAVYRELLRLVESESFRVLDQRISVAPARKAWLAWRTSIGFMPA